MKKRTKWTALIILFCAVVFVLVYTRPQTLEQRYPMLDFSECTEIYGHYAQYGKTDELVHIAVKPDAPHFETLVSLLTAPAYKTSLANLLPRGGVSYTPVSDSDFYWTVYFCFDNVVFPDGHSGSGMLLSVDNRLGELRLDFVEQDGGYIKCTVDEQEALIRKVLDIISLYPEDQ